MIRPVLSGQAEASIGRVNTLIALHKRWSRVEETPGNTSPGLRLELGAATHKLGVSPEDIVFPHLVAAAEEFCSALLLSRMSYKDGFDSEVAQLLWEEQVVQAISSWGKLEDCWKTWHQVRLNEFPHWAALAGYREARNALTHGLGGLTQLQTQTEKKRRQVIGRLQDAGVAVAAGRIRLTRADIDRCGQVVKEFIEWLDMS